MYVKVVGAPGNASRRRSDFIERVEVQTTTAHVISLLKRPERIYTDEITAKSTS
jgi:hypothetical protein